MDLARRWQRSRDAAALAELVEAHRRLVVSVAKRYRHFGVPLDDLVQEGNAALVHTANRFEPDRGARFASYAVWWIRDAIIEYVLKNRSVVRRITSTHKSLVFRFQKWRREHNVLGEIPPEGMPEVARSLGATAEAVAAVQALLAQSDVGISDDGHAEDASRTVRLVDERPSPEDAALDAIELGARRSWLRRALAALNGRERLVIARRRLTDQPSTLGDLAKVLGVSSERVRQIEVAALTKLGEWARTGAEPAVGTVR